MYFLINCFIPEKMVEITESLTKHLAKSVELQEKLVAAFVNSTTKDQ